MPSQSKHRKKKQKRVTIKALFEEKLKSSNRDLTKDDKSEERTLKLRKLTKKAVIDNLPPEISSNYAEKSINSRLNKV